MQQQLAGPGVQRLIGSEMDEGHGHQSRAHGAENPGGLGAAGAVVRCSATAATEMPVRMAKPTVISSRARR